MRTTRWAILGTLAALAVLTAPAALDAAGFNASVIDATGGARAETECDAEVEQEVTVGSTFYQRISLCIKIDE